MTRKIPVFYHVPKNAGTYISNYALRIFRYYRLEHTDWLRLSHKGETIRVLQLVKDKVIVARLLVGDPYFYLDRLSDVLTKRSDIEFDIDINSLTKEILCNLFLFFFIIEANGFKIQNNLLELIKEYEHFKFLILRDPFSRAQSLYNYNVSDLSSHDYMHGTIHSSSFLEYILSSELEDSWIIRNFLDISENTPIREEDFNKITKFLSDFNIYEINNTQSALDEVFDKCYKINVQDAGEKFLTDIHKNDNKYKKFKIEDLPSEYQSIFIKRTFWDSKLYNYFRELKQVNI